MLFCSIYVCMLDDDNDEGNGAHSTMGWKTPKLGIISIVMYNIHI